MRDQNRVAVIVSRDFLQRVEVLGHQDQLHDILWRGTLHGFGEIFDGVFQAGDNRLALIGDAFSLEALGLGLRLRLLDEKQLVGLGAGNGRFALALGGVYIIHRGLHLLIGDNVG